ncbi:MAG TPA: HNH endonuclease signature motif containing protein [Accumulibacter sp.]|nr:HNH endonuclease signature motif containing protein [Accumulibacter sp.]
MRSKDWLTVEEARSRLNYDPATGRLTWKKLRNTLRIGEEAKSLDVAGYVQVNISGTMVKGHRLAWLLHYGDWPDGDIDHINGVRNDNRISNLRCVSPKVNCQNQRVGSRPSVTGLIGVHLQDRGRPNKRYRAKIYVDGRQIHLGGYATPEEAHAAYVLAKRKHHEGCTL